MGIEYTLRGHHLRHFQLYLYGRIDDIKKVEFFDRVLSERENKLKIIESNDVFCDRCPYSDDAFCSLGEQRISKAIVAKRDAYLAQDVFGLIIGYPYPVLDVVEKLIPPPYLTGISAENFLRHTSSLHSSPSRVR